MRAIKAVVESAGLAAFGVLVFALFLTTAFLLVDIVSAIVFLEDWDFFFNRYYPSTWREVVKIFTILFFVLFVGMLFSSDCDEPKEKI